MVQLSDNDVLLVFTYAPAGLGHMRVMNALIDGLPQNIDFAILGTNDTQIRYWHRIISISPLIRGVVEWLQGGRFRLWFYGLYIWLLRSHTHQLYTQIKDIVISQRFEKKVIVIVSTHFGLAHQIVAIKEKLQKNLKIKLILIDQITDATSMEILYIPGADLIFVPSNKIKASLENYAHRRGLRETNIIVSPYPLSPNLNRELSEKELDLRQKQYTLDSQAKIKIVVPISGAAVGLAYYDKITYILGKSLDRCEIYIVVKDYMYTKAFIRKMKRRSWIKLISNQTDRKVVAAYDKLYHDETIGFEIVKPSEQSFKTLISVKNRGGAILLFTEPIGKQEYDNSNFLLDHQLIPSHEDQAKLVRYALENRTPSETECRDCLKLARHWKAIRLTNDPIKDARIIIWCLKVGVFSTMASSTEVAKQTDPDLGPNGVQLFWKKVEETI